MLAATPYMGVDSWYACGAKINDAVIRAMADLVVSTGMRDAGYRYVNIDDNWYRCPRRFPPPFGGGRQLQHRT